MKEKKQLQITFEVFDDILDSIREPILVLDADLKVIKANRSFYEKFKVKPYKIEGELRQVY